MQCSAAAGGGLLCPAGATTLRGSSASLRGRPALLTRCNAGIRRSQRKQQAQPVAEDSSSASGEGSSQQSSSSHQQQTATAEQNGAQHSDKSSFNGTSSTSHRGRPRGSSSSHTQEFKLAFDAKQELARSGLLEGVEHAGVEHGQSGESLARLVEVGFSNELERAINDQINIEARSTIRSTARSCTAAGYDTALLLLQTTATAPCIAAARCAAPFDFDFFSCSLSPRHLITHC